MRVRPPLAAAAMLALGVGPAGVVAQMEGARGVAPVANASDYQVDGIAVDTAGPDAEAARLAGWRLAQRRGWIELARRTNAAAPMPGDGALDQIVTAIVIDREEIGPTRYIARLGVTFDRVRAARLLGVSAYADRSPPILLLPLQVSGGVSQMFEGRSDWQAAWARFRSGGGAIDYVRPAGTGPDSLLLNAGQVGRRSRGWWHRVLDQYGASDVVVAEVTLTRQWPEGPIVASFAARHGPDATPLGGFALRVGSSAGLARLLDTGVQRLDALLQAALRRGALDPDATIAPPPAPVAAMPTDNTIEDIIADLSATPAPTPGTGAGGVVTVQYDSPSASSVANVEQLVRTVPGVRSAQTTSLALGGVSVMRVAFDGNAAAVRAAMEARGLQVVGEGATWRIRQAGGGGG